jgi:putative transcription factor
LRCEVCGKKIHGKPVKALIEGAKLTVCNVCAKYGTIVQEEPKPQLPPQLRSEAKISKQKVSVAVKSQKIEEVSLELVDDYDVRVRRAREKLGLTHEELGKRINEKVSVLKKIETRKIKPDNKLAAKLEHALKVKLLVPASEGNVTETPTTKQPSRALTLGDIVRLGSGEAEEKT